MTLQLAVLVSSIAGAILFFLAGYLLGCGRPIAKTGSRRTLPELASGDAVTDMSGDQRRESAVDQARRNPEVDALRKEGEACRSRLVAVERERDELERENRRQVEGKGRLHDQADEPSRNMELEQWKKKARQVDSLREEKFDLSVQLQQLQEENRSLKEQTGRMKELKDEQLATSLKIESHDRQVAALERLKEENARLSTLIAQVPELRSTVEQLQMENRELRSLGLAYKPAPPAGRTKLPEGLDSSMHSLLEDLGAQLGTGGRGTALADEQGLLIAGTSEYAEGLAVTAALCDGLMKQVTEILPLTRLHRLTMVDINSNMATVNPFRVGPDSLLLVTLSVGQAPTKDILDEFVTQASLLIGGGERS